MAHIRPVFLVLMLGMFASFSGVLEAGQSKKIPVITGIKETGATTAVATVHVPSGIRQVLLQTSGSNGWVTRAVAHVGGNATEVKFQIDRNIKRTHLRVVGSTQDSHPAVFFKGTASFSTRGNNQSTATAGLGNAVNLATGSLASDVASPATAQTVVESDIWKIRGNTLFFFNQYRGLQIIDITKPDAPVMTGRLSLPAVGEELYAVDDNHLILLARKGGSWDESEVIGVTITGGKPSISSRRTVSGWLDTSRMVGSSLYLITNGWQAVAGGAENWGTLISSFDFSNPDAPVERDSIWTTGYGNSALATDSLLFAVTTSSSDWSRSQVLVIDISTGNGSLQTTGTITAAGLINDEYKLGVNGDTLTVLSQLWPRNSGATSVSVETFSVGVPTAPAKLGGLSFGSGSWLYGTRLDGSRAYVVTSNTAATLSIVDLSDPANPTVAGHVPAPGYSTCLQSLGDRLVILGISGNRVAVSLYDVSTAAAPAQLSGILLGGSNSWSWSEANFDDKAFSVLPEAGMILLPLSSYDPDTGMASQVQIVDLGRDTLTARGVIAQSFWPRRATLFDNRILSISGRELLAVDATNRDLPRVTSDVALSWPVDRVFVSGNYIVEVENGADWTNQGGPTLRVARSGDPDNILAETVLDGDPIRGATVRNGFLYLAQAASQSYYYFGTTGTNRTPLTVTAYSLSNLPQITLTGSASQLINSPGWNPAMTALWPAEGVLVWQETDVAVWPLVYAGATPTVTSSLGSTLSSTVINQTGDGTLSLSGNVGMFPGFWGGSSGMRLFAFDVSNPQTPVFLSETECESGSWSIGTAFAGDHAIYSSHMGSLQLEKYPWRWLAPRAGFRSSGWEQGWFLDVIDFTNPSSPVVRDPASLPGELVGVSDASPADALLFTRGWNSPDNSTSGLYLNACAYDGISAWLVDSAALDGWSFSAAVSGSNVYVGRPNGTSGVSGSVEIWSLSAAGKLTNVFAGAVNEPVWSLRLVNRVLAVETNDRIQLFDASNPLTLGKIVDSSIPVWGDLGGADGDAADGLWVPLGDYGVWMIQP